MTELSALHIKITGDSGQLTTAVTAAKTQLTGLSSATSRTQAQTARLGGAMSMVAQRFNGARGQIQNVAFQLQDMAVQLSAGTSASIVFAQQGSQIASVFGPVGAIIGALAAVGIPALAFAFGSGAEKAEAMNAAMERQKAITEDLTSAVMALRLESEMLRTGTETEVEQRAIQENIRLLAERNVLEMERTQLINQANEAMGVINQSAVDALNARIAEIDANRASNEQLLRNIASEREKVRVQTVAKELGEKMSAIMTELGNKNLNGPWQTVLGSIQNAINKANEYRSAMAQAAYASELAATGQSSGPDAARTNVQFGGPIKLSPTGAGTAFKPTGGGGGGGGGGGLASQLKSELEALQEAMWTQEELLIDGYDRQQEVIKQALEQRLITQEEYQRLMQQAQATHDFAMSQSVNKGVSDTLSALGSLFQGSKKISAAIAVANSWLAFTEVLKDPAYVGRPWARIAAAGQALAAGLNAVRNIKSASPGSAGGGGGASGGGAAPQQNVQTLNFNVQNDSFGIGQNLIRQIATQLNEAQRNGSTLIRATVS